MSGALDVAYLYDSPGNDDFNGDGNRATLSGPGFSNVARDFDEVHAVSINGGFDELTAFGELEYQLFHVGNWN